MYQSKKELTMATANRKPPGFHGGISLLFHLTVP
jgi:hypothetical protein